MKNLEIPLAASADQDLRFEVETAVAADGGPNISYGLNLRNSDEAVKTEPEERPSRPAPVDTVMLQKLKDDLMKLPDGSGLEDYAEMPIEGFGAALLAGYGWQEGMGIGRNAKKDVKIADYKKWVGKEGLRYINVAMVTVLKNVTNVITAVGEMYLFSKHHDNRVWVALFLMIISAISGGLTDLSFNAVGYTWQIINCFLTASYSLTLRRVMDTAKQVTKSGNLNEFSMVLLNNTLSLPLGLLLIFVFNEVDYLSTTPLLRIPSFWLVMTFSGFLGLAISFTSMWFLHQTGATTYSLVGSLNKIPLSVAGIFLFHVPTSLENSASILIGLVAGVFFARAKMQER